MRGAKRDTMATKTAPNVQGKDPCIRCLFGVGYGVWTVARMVRVSKTTLLRWRAHNGVGANPRRRKSDEAVMRSAAKNIARIRRIKNTCPIEGEKQFQRDRMTFRGRLTNHRAIEAAIARRALIDPADERKATADRYKARYHGSVEFRLKEILRRRTNKVVRRGDRYARAYLAWLGCSPLEFKAHLEGKWEPWMRWENYGHGKGKWAVDHVQPCASFDLTQESEQRKCFHYSNMQPMCWMKNLLKGDKVPSQL